MVSHTGARIAHVPPLVGALLSAFPGVFLGALLGALRPALLPALLPALRPGHPLPGTLLVVVVVVLSRPVEKKLRLFVVNVRGCEWLCLCHPELHLLFFTSLLLG